MAATRFREPHLRRGHAGWISLCTVAIVLCGSLGGPAVAEAEDGMDTIDVSHGEAMMLEYFDHEVSRIEQHRSSEAAAATAGQWAEHRPAYRQKLWDMLGLWPLPQRTDLQPTVTGTIEHATFTVEKLHYQSMPGLYVSANLYLPRDAEPPFPAVLYHPGHTRVVRDGVSYGPKVADHYQNHPAWYARHGIACLIIDTLHAGEVRGVHHGTYSMDRWWWNNHGYTPGGVEVWNAVRGLDYLESREEIDPERLAFTGMSGGGNYAWLVMALDDRPVTSVPTAGVTDLRNQIVDQAIEGHCDCMFFPNWHQWDFATIGALCAPRPMMLANGTHDELFPEDGVRRLADDVAAVYQRHDAADHWKLMIREGGHTQGPFRAATYRWMHEHLHNEPIEDAGDWPAFFDRDELRVFGDTLPEDEINSRIDEHLAATADEPQVFAAATDWWTMRDDWLERLAELTFAGWPEQRLEPRPREVAERELGDVRLNAYTFESQQAVTLRLWMLHPSGERPPRRVELHVLDDTDWQVWLSQLGAAAAGDASQIIGPGADATAWPEPDAAAWQTLHDRVRDESIAVALVAPRGVGPTNWLHPDAPRDPIRRSFATIGQTRDGMRIWDVRQAIAAVHETLDPPEGQFVVEAAGPMAGVAMYAGIYERHVDELKLRRLPATHHEGPFLLNVRKVFDMPQALALALDRTAVTLIDVDPKLHAWADRLRRQVDLHELRIETR